MKAPRRFQNFYWALMLALVLLGHACVPLGSSIPGGLGGGVGGGSVGGGTDGGSGGGNAGAPSVSIPAPVVTRMGASDPERGIVTVTGFAGSVTGGNLVEVRNLTKLGEVSRWEKLLWGVAYADFVVTTLANPDGSFVAKIEAETGDQIGVRQIDANGNQGPLVRITPSYTPLTFGFAPTDLAVNNYNLTGPEFATEAFIIGSNGTKGMVLPFTFGNPPSLGSVYSLPDGVCPKPIAAGITTEESPTPHRLLVIDHDNLQLCDATSGIILIDFRANTSPYFFATAHPPLNMAIHPFSGMALITNDELTDTPVVIAYEFASNDLSVIGLPLIGPVKQLRTPSIAGGLTINSSSYGIAVAHYEDGSNRAFLLDLGGMESSSSFILPQVSDPREMKTYANDDFNGTARALLVDGAGSVHILAITLGVNNVQVEKTLAVGPDPVGVAISSDQRTAYVINRGNKTASQIDLTIGSETVVKTIDLGNGPTQVEYDSSQNQFALIQTNDQLLTILLGNPIVNP